MREGFSPGTRIRYMNLIKFSRIALIALLTLSCSLCPAQETPSHQTFPVDPNRITIDFPGGPLSKLILILRADKSSDLSIINPEKLDPILPAFSVHNQLPAAVIGALSQVLRPQGYLLSMMSPSPSLAVLTRAEPNQSKDGFAVFQLGFKLGNQSVEEITAAIQTACEFAGGDAGKLRFKFHPGTKMLFAAGPQLTIDHIVRQVINSLPDSPPKTPPPTDCKDCND